MTSQFSYKVSAYTGWDLWYHLLSPKRQALRIAKRLPYDLIMIELPSGACFRVEKGQATPSARTGPTFLS